MLALGFAIYREPDISDRDAEYCLTAALFLGACIQVAAFFHMARMIHLRYPSLKPISQHAAFPNRRMMPVIVAFLFFLVWSGVAPSLWTLPASKCGRLLIASDFLYSLLHLSCLQHTVDPWML